MTSLMLWSGGRAKVLLALALVLAAGALFLVSGRSNWTGSWKAALDNGTGTLGLIGCVCGGMAALATSSMAQAGWDHFVGGMRRGPIAWLGPLVGLWLLGVVGMLACTAVALGVAAAGGAVAAPLLLWALPLVTVTLAAEIGIGATIGVALPRMLSVPVAAVAPFLLEGASRGGAIPGVFRTGGVTGPLAGQTYDWSVLVLSALDCAALALALVVALSFQVCQPRRGAGIAVVTMLLACAAPPWWLLETRHESRYAFEAHPAVTCRGASPEVCISSDTLQPLDSLPAALHHSARPLVELGLAVPQRFVDEVALRRGLTGGLVMLVGDQASKSSVDARTSAAALASPRACPEFFTLNGTPPPALMARMLLADWISTRNGARTLTMALPQEAQWLNQPVEAQRTWVASTYDALRACRLTEIRLPFDTPL